MFNADYYAKSYQERRMEQANNERLAQQTRTGGLEIGTTIMRLFRLGRKKKQLPQIRSREVFTPKELQTSR